MKTYKGLLGGLFLFFPICAPRDGFGVAPSPYQCLRNFYVSKQGNDGNSGTSTSQAFLTLNRAAGASLKAGDCVNVLPGTYTEALSIGAAGNSDSATGYVTFKAQTSQAAKIICPAGPLHAVSLNANYIIFDGFDVSGSPEYGVSTVGRHHIKVLNSVVHDNGGGGIGLNWGDYYTVQGNLTYNNASTSPSQESGISLWEARAISDANPGFHIQILQNISYGNIEGNVPGLQNKHTDGEGIIIDSFHNQQEPNPPWANVNYPYNTLIENNLCFNNGGRGIEVYESDHVTVRNNSVFHNNVDRQNLEATRGELINGFGSNNLWENNLAVADPTVLSTLNAIQDLGSPTYLNPGVQWINNLTFNGHLGQAAVILTNTSSTVTSAHGNLLGVDPNWVKASIVLANADFHLNTGSPAIGAGNNDHPLVDLMNNPRASGPADLGAYAVPQLATAPPVIVAFSASPTVISSNQASTLSWTTSGATLLSIVPGIGDVSDLQSIWVNPATTTVYTLTASNGAGSSHRVTTVTVDALPTTPSPISRPDFNPLVFPNPWRSDRNPVHQITFTGLAGNSSVQIFTLSGHHVKTLPTTSALSISWDLTTESGNPVATGVYLYIVTNNLGQKARGKLAVIK